MASDIPGGGWPSSMRMAEALVSYMADPVAIQRRIREEFERTPGIRTIEAMRAKHLERRNKPAEPPFKPFEGYAPQEQRDKLIAINAAFVARLAAERRRSLPFANPRWRLVA